MALYPSGDIEFDLSVRISISPQHALPGISGILPEKSEDEQKQTVKDSDRRACRFHQPLHQQHQSKTAVTLAFITCGSLFHLFPCH
jgi:hypothetical protein